MKNLKIRRILLFAVILCTLISLQITAGCSPEYQNNKVTPPVIVNADFSENVLLREITASTSATISPNEIINVIIILEGQSLYEGISLYGSEYTSSPEGIAVYSVMQEIRSKFMHNINDTETEIEYTHTYDVFFNGFSANVRYGDIDAIKTVDTVEDVIISQAYAAPTAIQSQDAYEILMDTLSSGRYTSDYKGEGMSVAVIDTGVNCNHEVFADNIAYGAYTVEQMNNIISQNRLGGKWISSKVPYAYDYADNDSDVTPVNNHGTHVAGIAVGRSDVITGAAPFAQLVAMKVFSNRGGGAYNSTIVKAVEDAVILGVDVINLSLGIPMGFTTERESNQQFLNNIYKKAEAAGITVCSSAGNEYDSAYNGTMGAAFSSNPDYGAIGSPSSYTSVFSVASTNTYKTQYLVSGDISFTVSEIVDNKSNDYSFVESLVENYGYGDFEYVTVDGYGSYDDYSNVNVLGKVALVLRGGGITFEEKSKIAHENGAIACIVRNNVYGKINAQISNLHIPTAVIDFVTGIDLADKKTGTISILEENSIETLSEFSSWGPLGDLSLKPDASAPGGKIYSSYGDSYSTLSGTSMASPYVAGIFAATRQYIRTAFGNTLTADDEKALAYQLIMSTAVPFNNIDGLYISPRKQGAGEINFNNVVNTNAYLAVPQSDRSKLELGDDPDKTGIYNLQFRLVNMSDKKLSYNVNAFATTDFINSNGTLGGIENKIFSFDNASVEIFVNNTLSDESVTVEAYESTLIRVIITLSNEEKAFIDENYVNGAFVEGFAILSSDTETELSIPFLSFYGDYAKLPAFDEDVFSNSSAQMYETNFTGLYNDKASVTEMGVYAYELSDGYDMPEGNKDYLSLSLNNKAMSTVQEMRIGVLKNLSKLEYSVTNAKTGAVLKSGTEYNVSKTYYNTSSGSVSFHKLNIALNITKLGLENGQQIIVKVKGYSDYDEAVYEEISYPITIDNTAPVLDGYYGYYNGNGRAILALDVTDNHYLQDIQLYTYTNKTYQSISDYAIPAYDFEKDRSNIIEIDVSDFIGLIKNDTLGVKLEDYAFNSVIFPIENISSIFTSLSSIDTSDDKFTSTGSTAISNDKTIGASNTTLYSHKFTWTSNTTASTDKFTSVDNIIASSCKSAWVNNISLYADKINAVYNDSWLIKNNAYTLRHSRHTLNTAAVTTNQFAINTSAKSCNTKPSFVIGVCIALLPAVTYVFIKKS